MNQIENIGRPSKECYKLPNSRLRKMTLTGKVLFMTKSTIVAEIQGEEFTFNVDDKRMSGEKFKFVQVSELGAEPPIEMHLSAILESKTIQAVGLMVETHEVVFYGASKEEYARLDEEIKKAQTRSAT